MITQAVHYPDLATLPLRLADAEGVCEGDGCAAEHADRDGGAHVGGSEGGGEVCGAGHQSGGEQQDLPLPQTGAVSHRGVQLGSLRRDSAARQKGGVRGGPRSALLDRVIGMFCGLPAVTKSAFYIICHD